MSLVYFENCLSITGALCIPASKDRIDAQMTKSRCLYIIERSTEVPKKSVTKVMNSVRTCRASKMSETQVRDLKITMRALRNS